MASGAGFYGSGHWGRRVYWESIPSQHRELDVNQDFEKLQGVVGDAAESIMSRIGTLPDQRDPYKVKARDGHGRVFYVAESRLGDEEGVIRLIGERKAEDMPDGYEPLKEVALGWTAQFDVVEISKDYWNVLDPFGRKRTEANAVERTVSLVRSRNFDPAEMFDNDTSIANEVWIDGVDALPFSLKDVTVGQGDGTGLPKVAIPNAPLRLKHNETPGLSPPWLAYQAQMFIRCNTVDQGEIELHDAPDLDGGGLLTGTGQLLQRDTGNPAYLGGDSHGTINYETGEIVLALPNGDTIAHDQFIWATYNVRGYYLEFYPQRMIDFLARDFGFDNDKNDPEDVQRSTIANLVKYYGIKSTQDSYRIRGEISLFNVVALQLWQVKAYDLWLQFPSDRTFQFYDSYAGETRYYTDIEPRRLRLDDIDADRHVWDDDVGAEVPLLDQSYMFEDLSLDGMSLAMAYANDVTQGYVHPSRNPGAVSDVTALTDEEAASYSLITGYRVEISMKEELYKGWQYRRGAYGLVAYDGSAGPPSFDDPVFWIESQESWEVDGTDGTLIIVIGPGDGLTLPAVGDDVALRYEPGLTSDCGHCKSARMRIEVEPTAEALDYYETSEDVDLAITRLLGKLTGQLVPMHVRVLDYVRVNTIDIEHGEWPVGTDNEELVVMTAAFRSTFDQYGAQTDEDRPDDAPTQTVTILSEVIPI